MSVLANTQRQIANMAALLAKEEQALVEYPEEQATILQSIASLEKMQRQLEADFALAARSLGRDICSYRLVAEEGTGRLASLADVLGAFQKAVSVVYDAIKNGPKERATVGAQIAEATAFELGYTFVGSTGFVLTIPNERLLADELETDLDAAVGTFFHLAGAQTPQDIAEHVKVLGHGGIRAVRDWVNCHVRTGLGADIAWQRAKKTRISLLAQHAELAHLRDAISATSSETETQFQTIGELDAASLPGKTFSMAPREGERIRGTFENAISDAHAVKLPCVYKATITKKMKVNYATDDEIVSHFLDRLEEVK